MTSLSKKNHWANLRILLGPFFDVVLYNETWWPMLDLWLRYKPPSSWRILFRSGGYPRKFSPLKMFRALVVPSRGYHKGIIIHWGKLKRRFSCGRPVMNEKKRGCNGSVCPCTQKVEQYVRTGVRQAIYKTRQPEHPHLPIHWYEWCPQGPPSQPITSTQLGNVFIKYW